MSKNINVFMSPDAIKLMPAFKPFPFDAKLVMESFRKNIQALSDAQQMTLEGFQTIAQRHSGIMSQVIEDQLRMARELIAEGTPEEKIVNQAEAFQNFYERGIKNMREIKDMMSKSSSAGMDIINDRIVATLDEVKSSLKVSKSNVTPLKKAA